ncbi:hypothetical protein DYD21_08205 [Rhodohalobacter sp. SW132]|uniref:hypothetical protein n=1 Tax=Rhodohalobacter sp. SW132 TaxID=2293433 RepID=UPI000E223722|nr:hypothetical protein [Rhodohalobacter sp. SW132]REL37754.1 hypothetical protein DYD21_08205 [Rhodohalobacter sp. SW132]
MDSKNIHIKVKLDVPKNTIAYHYLREQWENEGGAIGCNSRDEWIPADQIPFRPGEYFKVLTCQTDVINDELFLLADIERVTELTSDLVQH